LAACILLLMRKETSHGFRDYPCTGFRTAKAKLSPPSHTGAEASRLSESDGWIILLSAIWQHGNPVTARVILLLGATFVVFVTD